MGFFQYFISIVLLSAFYSFAITSIFHSIPAGDIPRIGEDFNNSTALKDYGTTTQKFQTSLQTQKQFGFTDLGALAFFSGNILLDLSVNFFFAIPSMFSLFFTGLFYLFHIDVFLQTEILTWVKAILSIISTIFLLQFILGARTQSLQVV